MRKFLLNGGVISAAVGVIPLLKKSTDRRSKWSTAAALVTWLGTVAMAVASVREETLAAREFGAEQAEQADEA